MSRLWTSEEIRAVVGREIDRRNRIGTQFRERAVSSRDTKDFRFFNDLFQTIPAHAVLQPVDIVDVTANPEDTQRVWAVDVQKADSTGASVYFVNRGIDILYNENGYCNVADTPTKVMIDPNASPVLGDRFAPTPDQWYLTTDAQGPFVYLGLNDGTIALFQQGLPTPDSLVIGVTLSSTAAITGTVNSRPPGWDAVPGESAGSVSITNPSSLSLSSTGLSFHAAYCNRNDTSTWELIGGAASAASEPAYGSMTIPSSTLIVGNSAYQAIPVRSPLVTAYGLTASTASFNFTVVTEGDYYIDYVAGGISLESVGSTEFLATFGIFKNSSGGFVGFAQEINVQNSSGKTFRQDAQAAGILHLRTSDTIDFRVFASTGNTVSLNLATLNMHLIRATTST